MTFPVRFKVLGLAVLLAGITYLDRICISMAAPYIQKDLGLDDVRMGYVFSAFTLAYALFEIPTGAWGDKIGTRRVLTRIVIWWSAFTCITGAVFNYTSLLAVRFLFGLGEAGAWPNVARTFSRWFPLGERGTVQGIFFMGAHLAGGVTPYLVQRMLTTVDWRTMFVLFGSIGFFWCALWYWWFRDEPSQHPSVTPEELALIQKGRGAQAPHHLDLAMFRKLFGSGTVIGLCMMYFTQSYGFMFYITWLPRYLKNAGFDPGAVGILAGLPLTLSVFADLFGGLTADFLSRRLGLRTGRAVTGGGSLFLAGVFVVAGAAVSDKWLSAVLIAIGGGLSAFLLGAAWGTILDIGGEHTGVVGAAMNTAGQVGAFICPILAAKLVQDWGYTWHAPLYVTGVLYMLGALCWVKIDPTKRVL